MFFFVFAVIVYTGLAFCKHTPVTKYHKGMNNIIYIPKYECQRRCDAL